MGWGRSRWSQVQLFAVVVALSAIAGVPAVAQATTSYSPGQPSVDGISSTSASPAPWNTSQGVTSLDGSSVGSYQFPELSGGYTFNFGGPTTSSPTEPNVAVYPAETGSTPFVSGYVGTPGPLSGYCTSSTTNTSDLNETGSPLSQPAGSTLPFSPYYFPQIVLNSDGSLTGYFDWRPKDADEAIVVARSTDGGITWTAEGEALEQNPGYCPSADTNDDGEGHPFVADFGGGASLYTLQRAVGDYAGSNLLVNPVNPSASDPLSGDTATASIGVDPNTFATGATALSTGSGTSIPVSTLGGDATNGNSTTGLIPIPDPSALPNGSAEYEDITQGNEASGGTTPPIITCTGTSGSTGSSPALTGCTSPSGITVAANDDLVEVIGTVGGIVNDASGNTTTTIPYGPQNAAGTLGTDLFLAPYTNKTTAKTNLGSLQPSANSNTLTYLLNANAPNRYYIDGSTVYCTQGNADPTQAIETCTTTNPNGVTVNTGDAVVADPITPAATGGGPVQQTNGLIAPDGIIGSLPASANSAWGEPSTGHVVLYTEKLVNYFIEGGINGTVSSAGASTYSNFKTDTLGTASSPKSTFATSQTGSSSTLATGFVEAPGTTATNYNISPFPTESEQLPTSGSFNVYVGGQTATGGADLDKLTCTGWDVNTAIADLYNPNLHTIDLLGCTGGTGGSAGDGFNAGHQGNWVAGPGAAIETTNSAGKSVLQQIGEGKAMTTGQAQKLFGNNEDYEVVRAAYTTDGVNFDDLGPISGSSSGASAGATTAAPQTCPSAGAGATAGGYTDISNPCQQDAPAGTGSTPAALDSSNPQGDSPASLPAGTADAVELRWPGARGTIITNPDGSIGMFLSGAWASDGDSDAFNQIFYTQSSDGGKTWSVPQVVVSTDYTFAASVAQDQALANGQDPQLGVSGYYEGRAYDPTVVQNANGSLTLVFAGYRVPNPVKAAGTPLGTNSSALYCEGISSNGCTTGATPTVTETDPALYRNILTETLASSSSPLVGSSSNLQSSAPGVPVGTSVTYTDTITVPAPGTGTPTGTVTFEDNGNVISGCQSVPLSDTPGSDTATCQETPAAGADSITALYSGDSNYATSTGTQTEQVGPPPGDQPAQCQLTNITRAGDGGHDTAEVTVNDAAGIASITGIIDDNASVSVPDFTPGTTGPLIVMATKSVQGTISRFAFQVIDIYGKDTSCA
jgi:hypothetical protein